MGRERGGQAIETAHRQALAFQPVGIDRLDNVAYSWFCGKFATALIQRNQFVRYRTEGFVGRNLHLT
jgi:hypothetical protein